MTGPGASGRVVILDRDGTLVVDRGYLADPMGLKFARGAVAGLELLREQRLVVITNQSGVGRGLFTAADLEAMNLRLKVMVEEVGARLEGIYACPHAPEDHCGCRKPAQGLMQRAAAELDFDPAEAVVVGDKESDVDFGQAAGALTILIADAPPARTQAHHVCPDMEAAARIIVGSTRARRRGLGANG
jgi:D-glycero-D-manno-heptose 1,7-bisphosphate phosphatase